MLPAGLAVQKLTGIQVFSTEESGRVLFWGTTIAEGNAATLLMCAVVLLCALISYRLIESPGRRAMRNYVSQWRRQRKETPYVKPNPARAVTPVSDV